jgi:hypothetical protein
MGLRYKLFIGISLLINFICWWYVIIFCGIYVTSSTGWIQGSVMGIVMDWCIISLLVPFIKAVLRILIRKYPHLKFLVVIDYFFFIIGFFC